MATRILDSDIMVLQKKSAITVAENFPPNGGPYPNLNYDLETFHFFGSDLRYTVEQYVEDSHQFVKIEGDQMSGNLEISYPKPPSEKEEDTPAQLTLTGFQNGTMDHIVQLSLPTEQVVVIIPLLLVLFTQLLVAPRRQHT